MEMRLALRRGQRWFDSTPVHFTVTIMDHRKAQFPNMRESCLKCEFFGTDDHFKKHKFMEKMRWGCDHDTDGCEGDHARNFKRMVEHI